MTRFHKEISAGLGAYWQKDAARKVHDYVEEVKSTG